MNGIGTALVVPALLFLLCQGLPARAGGSVPFKATATLTTPHFEADLQNCLSGVGPCCFNNEGTGEGTHLGRFTVSNPNCGPAGVALPHATWGTMTLAAANGDQLLLETHGVIVAASPTVLVQTDEFVIIGGSGRLNNATGQGIVTEIYTLDPEHLFVFEGTIDFKKK